MFGRKKLAMLLAEFLGTGILTAVVLTVSRSQIGYPLFVAIAAGLALAAGILVFGSVSGAQFNPAVTIGLWSARRIKTLPALTYVAAQLLGGICAYLLFTYFVDKQWPNAGKFDGRVMVAEVVGTFVFCLGWAAAAYNKLDTAKTTAVIGISLTVGITIASVASAGMLNPAVAMGARMWVWGTYVLGPILGAIIAFNLYGLFFAEGKSLLDKATPAKKK